MSDVLVTPEARDHILDTLVDAFTETVDQVKAGRDLDASDAVEILTSIALGAAGALVTGPAGGVLAVVGPLVGDLITNAVEAAEAKARTVERLAERIADIEGDIEAHAAAIAALQLTEKVEIFEKVRIAVRRDRIKALQRKVKRLRVLMGEAPVAE